tara:strand:- start:692 stop:1504 length:813 start_codon:yes stop_codon:yes gene_type:complete
MKTIKNKVYTKKDFNNVIVPSWQRWRNENNVKDLAEAVSTQGQMRDVLISVTKDGTKILTDGAHLKSAMLDVLNLKKISVKEIYVKDQEDARNAFISFNTRGKVLKQIDYVVSYAGSNHKEYKKFLRDVLQSPKNLKEASDVHSRLFTIPALIKIFLGKDGKNIKNGSATLTKEFNRTLNLVEYLGENYLKNGKLIKHLEKNGKSMKLNGGSIIPVMFKLRTNNILEKTNKEILDILIDFTTYHFNSTQSCSFTKDAVEQTFSTYVKELV